MRGGAARVAVVAAAAPQPQQKPKFTSAKKVKTIPVASRVYETSMSKQRKSSAASGRPTASFKESIKAGKHSVWSKRVECYDHMKSLLAPSSDASLSASQANRLVELLCSADRGVSDPHFKVCHAALQTAVLFIPQHHQVMLPFLERFLTSVLPLLGDSKKQIKTEANRVVNEVRRSASGEVIVAALAKIITINGEKFRIGCTELMMQLIPESGSFFSAPINMRHVIKAAGRMHSNKRSALSKAAGLLLRALYKYNRELFVTQFKTISEKEQDRLYPLLASCLPNFSDELKTADASDRHSHSAEDGAAHHRQQQPPRFASHKHETLTPEIANSAFEVALVSAAPLEEQAHQVEASVERMSLDSRSSTPKPTPVHSPEPMVAAPKRESEPEPAPGSECEAKLADSSHVGYSSMGAGRTSMGAGREEPRQSPTRPPRAPIDSPVVMQASSAPPLPLKSAAKRLIGTPHSALDPRAPIDSPVVMQASSAPPVPPKSAAKRLIGTPHSARSRRSGASVPLLRLRSSCKRWASLVGHPAN